MYNILLYDEPATGFDYSTIITPLIIVIIILAIVTLFFKLFHPAFEVRASEGTDKGKQNKLENSNSHNKVVRVQLVGGIIGLFINKPQYRLNH